MNSVEIRAKIECHTDQARRLLLNFAVAEYQHHINSIGQLESLLVKAEAAEAEAAKTQSEEPKLEESKPKEVAQKNND